MRRILAIVLLLGGLALLAGAAAAQQGPAMPAIESPPVKQGLPPRTDLKSALRDAIDRLLGRLEEAPAEVGAESRQTREVLQRARGDLDANLSSLQRAKASNWEALRRNNGRPQLRRHRG
jgi:hypothetical protein